MANVYFAFHDRTSNVVDNHTISQANTNDLFFLGDTSQPVIGGYVALLLFLVKFSRSFHSGGGLLGLYVWFACTLGFFGVLLIVRPDETNFQWTIFLPILAAILYAVAMVLTSIKCKNDDPITLSITLNVAFIVSGILLALFSGSTDSYLFGQWQPLNSALIGTIAILAIVIVVGSVGAAIAYQNGPPATIAIFDYVYLLFSLIWGVLFFAHTPNITELVGILAIAAAGYTVISKTQTP